MIRHNLTALVRTLPRHAGLVRMAAAALSNRVKQGVWNGHPRTPEQVTVVVTDICNLHCKMCQYAHSDSPGYRLNQVGMIDETLFRKLMDETTGSSIVSITGGEPLLHPRIHDMIHYAKRMHRFVTLTTNGWRLARRVEDLCAAGLDLVVVSLDGPQEIHDRIRGRKSFERLSEGLRAILRVRGRPLVFISMAISDLNFTQLGATYDLACWWGVDGINFNHLWMQTNPMVASHNRLPNRLFRADQIGWDVQPGSIDPARIYNQLEALRRRNRRGKMLMVETPFLDRKELSAWYRHPERMVKWTTANCAWTRLKMWPDGAVKPCRAWGIGNLNQQHAMEIWNGPKMRRFRHFLGTHGALPICARCCYMAYR